MLVRSLIAVTLLLCGTFTHAQTPEARYKAAKAIFSTHVKYSFNHDDSADAMLSIQQMWTAIADFIVERRAEDPKISAAAFGHALCLLTAEPTPPDQVQQTIEEQCEPTAHDLRTVVDLGHNNLLVAPSTGEIGTVFIIGPPAPDVKSVVLWSIAEPGPQPLDPDELLAAWRPDRAGLHCGYPGLKHSHRACGPLYAELGLLPPDQEGNPRFYIDAGYAQEMGATIAKQTSIWTWANGHAHLLWIDLYGFMIDQSHGSDFANGILSVGGKTDYRSFFSCGSCEGRQIVHDVLIEPNKIRDLGTHPLVPELDLIDNLFWRIAHGQSTDSFAAPKIAASLRPTLIESRKSSVKIDPHWFSTGMIDDWLVTQTHRGALVCVAPDDLGPLIFTLRRTINGGYFVSSARRTTRECATRTWLP